MNLVAIVLVLCYVAFADCYEEFAKQKILGAIGKLLEGNVSVSDCARHLKLFADSLEDSAWAEDIECN
jgi:hypothetical protein